MCLEPRTQLRIQAGHEEKKTIFLRENFPSVLYLSSNMIVAFLNPVRLRIRPLLWLKVPLVMLFYQGLQPTKRDPYGRLILGDIITSVNGTKVTNGSDLYRILDQCKVGETVSFWVFFDLYI